MTRGPQEPLEELVKDLHANPPKQEYVTSKWNEPVNHVESRQNKLKSVRTGLSPFPLRVHQLCTPPKKKKYEGQQRRNQNEEKERRKNHPC